MKPKTIFDILWILSIGILCTWNAADIKKLNNKCKDLQKQLDDIKAFIRTK